MMLNHKTHLTLIAMAGLFIAGPALAQSPPNRRDVMNTSSRLLGEQRRQESVRRSLTDVTQDIDWLVEQLQANQMFDEAGGQKVTGMNTTVREVESEHVPGAADALRLARSRDIDRTVHLAKAEVEIQTTIDKLDRLLGSEQMSLESDLLAVQLKAVVQAEKELRRQTADWGKQLLTEPEAAMEAKQPLTQAQEAVHEQLEEFKDALAEAKENQTDPAAKENFERIEKMLEEERPDRDMQQAARDIDDEKPISAVENQDQAIASLENLEKELTEGQVDPYEQLKQMHDSLERIVSEQQQLQDQVESSAKNPEDFEQQQPEMRADQQQLTDDLQDAMDEAGADDAALMDPSVQESLDQAKGAMDQADQQLGESQPEPATESQQQAIDSMTQAMQDIEQAMAEASDLAQPPPGEQVAMDQQQMPGEPEDMQGMEPGEPQDMDAMEPGEPMDMQGMEPGEPQDMDAMEPGEPMDMQGMEPGEQQPMEPGEPSAEPPTPGEPTDGPPQPGPPGPPQPGPPVPGPPMPGSQPTPMPPSPFADPDDRPMDQQRTTMGSTVVQGEDVERTAMHINPMTGRNRGELIQQYAQQLPPEFRQQVSEYFEVLSEEQ